MWLLVEIHELSQTPDVIKSLAENVGDPNTEITIYDTTLDDISVSTTRDVDAVRSIVGSIGGVGTTSDNKNDWEA
jgi:hypothetical protein